MSWPAVANWAMAMAVVGWTALVGFGWAVLLQPRSGIFARLGLGFLIGLALVVVSLLGWQLIGQRYAPVPLFLVSAVLALSPWLALRMRMIKSAIEPGRTTEPSSLAQDSSPAPIQAMLDRSLQLVIGLMICLNLAEATYQPTLRWDELSHHMLAAKIYAHEGGITRESGMLTQDVRTYPPFVPLSRVWLYELVGSDNPAPNHLVSWAMFASFLALFHARLHDFVAPTTSLVFTLIAGLLMFWGGTESLIDFPLIAYGGLGILFAAAALKRREPDLALVSGLLLGIAGLVRPDGLAFGLMNLGLLALFALLRTGRWIAVPLVLSSVLGLALGFFPWMLFKSRFWGASLSPDTYLGGGFGDMIFTAVRSGAFDPNVFARVVSFVFPEFNQAYGYILLLAVLLIPLGLPDRRPNAFLCAVLLANVALYLSALYAFLLAGRTDLALRDETAIRFGTRLLPLLVFTIGACPLVDEVVNRVVGWRNDSSSAEAEGDRALAADGIR